jgi:hypothetical protein
MDNVSVRQDSPTIQLEYALPVDLFLEHSSSMDCVQSVLEIWFMMEFPVAFVRPVKLPKELIVLVNAKLINCWILTEIVTTAPSIKLFRMGSVFAYPDMSQTVVVSAL